MKLRIERDQLTDIITWIARSLPQRPSVPVMAGIMLRFDGAVLTAEGFDYEVSTRAHVDIQGGGDPGSVLVSGRLFAEITKALPNKPVDLTSVGTHLELVCGSGRFTLPTMPVEDFPQLPVMPRPVGTIDAGVFAAAVAQAAVAAGRDESLPMMTGVRVELDGARMALLATDRYRLVVRDIAWQPTNPDVNTSALVPGKTLAEVAKTLGAAGGDVTVALATEGHGEGMIGFEAGGRSMTSRLLDGANYPPVRSLFPEAHPSAAVVPVASLIEVVKRVALVAERTTPVLLTFTDGDNGVTVEAGGAEEARASEALGISSYAGQDTLTIGFNPQYLIDGLTSLGTQHAHIGFVDAFKPAVISPADEDGEPTGQHRYLIMPIRVSR
ncbi:DNA polymerase III subunit beta [Micromonospora sp. NPDC053740]|uniref:DNA polymerase III subunit beta n=1 Tax=Micromonospora sp. NPDC053740 TaxID=3155173 RepID=UPI003440CC7F